MLKDQWAASRRAEEQGNIIKALEIHCDIINQESASYAVMLRAGWLYYRLGLYEVSLRYYELACSMSNDDWPLHGINNCLAAMEASCTSPEQAESMGGTGGEVA